MNTEQQYILARDTIDMIRRSEHNTIVLEYLEGVCFSLARIFETSSAIEWDTLASICDQRYSSLGSASEIALDVQLLDQLYEEYISKIPAST